MTVHTAKGLEFPYVFVAGLSDGVFPTSRAICAAVAGHYNAIEEERRLAYVAFTRAQKNLFLTYNTGYSYVNGKNLDGSMFIKEIEKYININKTPLYEPKKYKIDDLYSGDDEKTVEIVNKSKFISNVEYRPGNMVKHVKFGKGIVINADDDYVTIAFEDVKVGVMKVNKKFNGLSKE